MDKEGFPPNYSIIPVLKESEITPGDELKIGFYFSGYGEIEINKLHITFSYPGLFQSPEGLLFHMKTAQLEGADPNEMQEAMDESDYIHPLDDTGVTLHVPDEFFAEELEEDGSFAGRMHGEVAVGNVPPYVIHLYTSENAKPGNYDIISTFTYSNGESVEKSTVEKQFRIQNRRERIEPAPQIAGIIAAVIGWIALLSQISLSVLLLGIIIPAIPIILFTVSDYMSKRKPNQFQVW